MLETSSHYSLVLIGRYPGKDVAVAQSLARCLGREESWGLRIVSSAPIVVFEKLTEKQARKINDALAAVIQAGCKFEIQPGSNAALPKVGWANPPKINGLSLAELLAGSDPYVLDPTPQSVPMSAHSAPTGTHPATTAASQPAGSAEPSNPGTVTLILPCPYTGQKIKVTLTVALSRGEGGTAVNVAASAAQATVGRATERSVNAVSGTIVPPSNARARQSGGYVAPRISGPYPLPGPVLAQQSDPQRRETRANAQPVGFSGARPQSGPNAGQSAQSAQSAQWRRNMAEEIPLPDVPVLPSSPHAPKPGTAIHRRPLPLDSHPMDLSTFEANLGVESHEAESPYVDPGPNVLDDASEIEVDDEESPDEPGSEEILCSVYIERSSSPVVHELVAELHGIPEAEASEMCVGGSVALAENIPLPEARELKRRCAAIVRARIVRTD